MNTLEITARFDPNALRFRKSAEHVAQWHFDHTMIEMPHFVYGGLLPADDTKAGKILKGLNLDRERVRAYLGRVYPSPSNSPILHYSEKMKGVFAGAAALADQRGDDVRGREAKITDIDLLVSILKLEDPIIDQLFLEGGRSRDAALRALPRAS